MTALLPTLAIAVLAPLAVAAWVAWWGWTRVRTHTRPAWTAVLGCTLLPWAVPPSWPWLRLPLSVFAITLSMHCWTLGHGRPADARAWSSPWHYLLWLLLPPEVHWPRDDDDRARSRHGAMHRGLRALAKAPCIAALVLLEQHVPAVHGDPWTEAFWALWLTWLAGSTIADLGSAVVMAFGVAVDESFASPPLARSPREFWARRWNLIVAGFIARQVFAQVGGRRHPLRATAIAFVGSGVMHELFVILCLGRVPQRLGWMTAFFVLHGAAVMLQMLLDRARTRRRRRRGADARARGRGLWPPLAVAAHIAWMGLTAPLFFGPLGEAFAPATTTSGAVVTSPRDGHSKLSAPGSADDVSSSAGSGAKISGSIVGGVLPTGAEGGTVPRTNAGNLPSTRPR
ncbi:MAG: hypothetical protein IPH07_12930 [Deltaproteobacteria bacterium]|nr:hypothetical protein [Deltaproteobacteria bacterium]MBK8717026.1 hypothetical protein [Deltaproteobacteria bacterium]MBP7290619.1 hypothetical protein [Nannocystaceae bacterium]